MASTKRCECAKAHPFQDTTYGKGNRVSITIPGKQKGEASYRCTVCGVDFKSKSEPTEIYGK